MEKIENLPKITADYFIPLGPACRPAYWLQRTGLRQCSLPFDWLGLYDLNLIVRTLHEGVRFWFETYTETEPEPKTRVVVNETINLRSMNDAIIVFVIFWKRPNMYVLFVIVATLLTIFQTLLTNYMKCTHI